jgi:NAD(P)-dependent dehydrogenase (short-subunit alcohol dehydrogenase family)
MNINKKPVAIVTGASSGIGLGVTRACRKWKLGNQENEHTE